VDSLIDELGPEFPLFRESGGGVTLSGGEPTQAASFAAELVAGLSAENIGVAMETCGQFAWRDDAAALIAVLDLVLFDIKLVDSGEHQRWCGSGNQNITDNLARLVAMAASGEGPPLWPRLPLVPGVTDGVDNLRGWAGVLGDLGLAALTLVPYHRLGSAKHDWMGTSGQSFATAGDESVQAAITTLGERGVTAHLPGEEPWP
jgi:pyruvate-formate lyase-activating enzyme